MTDVTNEENLENGSEDTNTNLDAEALAAKLAEMEAALKKATDEKASLLKETMKTKEAKKKAEEAAKELAAKTEGLDLDAIREMLANKEKEEEETAKKNGEFSRILEKQAEAAKKREEALAKQLEEMQSKIAAETERTNALTLSNAFASSRFIQDKLTLTANKTKALYADHFEIVDGELVAYDKPKGSSNRTPIVDASGSNVDFETAIETIINADPEKDHVLKADLKGGAGSKQTTVGETRNLNPLSSLDKIAAGLKNKKNFGG